MQKSRLSLMVVVLMLLSVSVSAAPYLSTDFVHDPDADFDWIYIRGAQVGTDGLVLEGEDLDWLDAMVVTWAPFPFTEGALFEAELTGFDVTTPGHGFDLLAHLWVTPTLVTDAYYNTTDPGMALILHYSGDSPDATLVLYRKGSSEVGNGETLWEGTFQYANPLRLGLYLTESDYEVRLDIPFTTTQGTPYGSHGLDMAEWPDGAHLHLTSSNYNVGRGSLTVGHVMIEGAGQ